MTRRRRWLLGVSAAFAWAALMWFVVFPWLDDRFVSRPAF